MDQADEQSNPGSRQGKILVTGASGFIGGHVTRYLASKGLSVSCLVRQQSNLEFIRDLPVDILTGDILDPQSLLQAFTGMDAIIHTAAKVGDWETYDDFYRVNVTGTLNVLEAAFHRSIRRVIITGSVASYGEEDHPGLKDESSPYRSHYPYFLDRFMPSGMNHYRDTKALCTQKALEYAAGHQMDLIVIEPVWVYGENEFSSGFYEYIKSVKSGLFMVPGNRYNQFHVIYAGDLARAYYHALQINLKGIHRIIAGNRYPENMNMIYRIFCREAGLKKPFLVSKYIIYPVGLLMEMIYLAFRSGKPPVLTRARVNMLYDSIGYDTSLASDLIDFEAAVTLEEGIAKTVKWYRDHKFI